MVSPCTALQRRSVGCPPGYGTAGKGGANAESGIFPSPTGDYGDCVVTPRSPRAPARRARELEDAHIMIDSPFHTTSERLQFERPNTPARRRSPPQAEHHPPSALPYHSLFAPGLLASSKAPIHPPPRPVHCSALRPAAYTTRQTPPIAPTDAISPEFARFYSQLPDKVKQRQFSPEERELLDSHAERITPRLSQERAPRLRRNRSVPSLRSNSTNGASSASELSEELLSPCTPADDMDAELMSAFQWIDSEPDLTLDDYHTHVSNLAEPKPKWIAQVPGFRRHRSHTNFSLRSVGRQSSEHRTTTADGPRTGAMTDSWRSSTADDSAIPPLPSLEILKATTVTIRQSPPASPLEPRHTAQRGRPTLKEWGPARAPVSGLAKEVLVRTSRDQLPERQPTAPPPKAAPSQQARDPLEERESWRAPIPATPKATPVQPEHAPRLSPEARLKLEKYLAEDTNPDEPEPPIDSVEEVTSTFEPSFAHGEMPGVTFLDDNATDVNAVAENTKVVRGAPVEEEYIEDDAPSFGHVGARPSSSSYEPTHSGPPSPRTATGSGNVTAPSSHNSDTRSPYIYALPPIATGREMTLRMTLTRPELREDARAILPPTPAYVQNNPPPKAKFLGSKREAMETITTLPASRNPLGLDELFAPDPLPLRQERNGLRKLFGRK